MSHGPQKKGKNRKAKGFTPRSGVQAGEQAQSATPKKKGQKKPPPKKAAVPKQGQPPKVTQQRSSKRQWGSK